ncbi:MAG: outer membrane protein assembly factor BamB, partial [Natronomonas sp.]
MDQCCGAPTPTTRGGSPDIVGDTVYANSGGVTALDAETGECRWVTCLGNPHSGSQSLTGYTRTVRRRLQRSPTTATARGRRAWCVDTAA